MKHLVFVSTLLASSCSLAGTYNYAEIGFGASKWQSISDSESTDKFFDNVDPSATIRISTGSRLGHSINNWFELGYLYEAPKEFGVSESSSQTILASLKFTTDPRTKLSAYAKIGFGKQYLASREKEDGNSKYTSISINVYQAAFGVGYRLSPKQSISFETQTLYDNERYKSENADFYNHFFTISLNQFL